jgi:hypothetical protein
MFVNHTLSFLLFGLREGVDFLQLVEVEENCRQLSSLYKRDKSNKQNKIKFEIQLLIKIGVFGTLATNIFFSYTVDVFIFLW